MASSLFGQQQSSGGLFARLNQIKGLMSGDPQAMYQQMMQSNPQFAQFVRDNQGKSPEQIAAEHGIDMGQVRQFFGK